MNPLLAELPGLAPESPLTEDEEFALQHLPNSLLAKLQSTDPTIVKSDTHRFIDSYTDTKWAADVCEAFRVYALDLSTADGITERIRAGALCLYLRHTQAKGLNLFKLTPTISRIAESYFYLARYDDALPFLRVALTLNLEKYGANHRNTLLSMNELSVALGELGDFESAREIETTVVKTCLKMHGNEHPDTLTSQANLAVTLSELGEFEAALELQIDVFTTQKRILGKSDPDTLTSLANLAATHFELGDLETARARQIEVLWTQRRVLGANHPETLTSKANLATTHSKLGNLQKAKRLQTAVVEAQKRTLGKDHRTTLKSLASLAITLFDLGDLDSAYEMESVVLNSSISLFGEEHPDSLASKSALAVTVYALGNYERARQMQVEVLEVCRRLYGNDHPETLSYLANLTSTLSELGEYEDAHRIGTEVHEAQKRVLGERHPDTLITAANVAVTSREMGNIEEAFECGTKALEALTSVLGEHHPETLKVLSDLATTYYELGDLDGANQRLKAALNGQRLVLGDDHPDTLSTMSDMAVTLHEMGDVDGARQIHREVLDARNLILGKDHAATLTSMHNLASCLMDLGDADGALELQLDVLRARTRIFGDDHPTTLMSMVNLASTLSELGDTEAARDLELNALRIQKRTLGIDHPDTLRSEANLAETFREQGDLDSAQKANRRVLNTRRRILGEDHPDTLRSRTNLASTLWELDCFEEAREHFSAALAGRKRLYGKAHTDTLRSRTLLAQTLSELGKTEQALHLYTRTLQSLLKTPWRDTTWFEVAGAVAMGLEEAITTTPYPGWFEDFDALSKQLCETLETYTIGADISVHAELSMFHGVFVNLCLHFNRLEHIPRLLARIHGPKLASIVSQQIHSTPYENMSEAERHFLKTKRVLARLQIESLTDIQTNTDADSIRQATDERAKEFDRHLKKYRELREQVSPELTDLLVETPASLPNLRNRLQTNDQAILLLVDLPESEMTPFALFVPASGPLTSVPLPGLIEIAQRLGQYQGNLASREGMRGDYATRISIGKPLPPDTPPGPQAEDLMPLLDAHFKTPLLEALETELTQLRRLYWVTHGRLHSFAADFTQLTPQTCRVHHYPGTFFLGLPRPKASSHANYGPSLLHTYTPAATDDVHSNPIPMVITDHAIANYFLAKPIHQLQAAIENDSATVYHDAITASHGNQHGDLAKPGRPFHWRSMHLRVENALVLACLLGRTEDKVGEPLGWVAQSLINGAHTIVAATAPISDFYTPLFSILYNQTRFHARVPQPAPDLALAEAKRRLISGHWYEEDELAPEHIEDTTETLVKRFYVIGMNAALDWAQHCAETRQIVGGCGEAKSYTNPLNDWLFPESFDNFLDTVAKNPELLSNPTLRNKTISSVLNRLIKERASLPVQDLANAFVCFGESPLPESSEIN